MKWTAIIRVSASSAEKLLKETVYLISIQCRAFAFEAVRAKVEGSMWLLLRFLLLMLPRVSYLTGFTDGIIAANTDIDMLPRASTD